VAASLLVAPLARRQIFTPSRRPAADPGEWRTIVPIQPARTAPGVTVNVE